MSTDNIPGTLSGDKTQTRRTSGLNILNENPNQFRPTSQEIWDFKGQPYFEFEDVDTGEIYHINSKYGKPMDTLWVREAWRIVGWVCGEPFVVQFKDGEEKYDVCFDDEEREEKYWIQCSEECEEAGAVHDEDGYYHFETTDEIPTKWRPSIFMPKAASRITLEITDIRLDRLLAISEEDAIAEGIGHGFQMNTGWPDYLHIKNGVCELTQDTAIMSFASLWEKINGKGSWKKNPWVWVVKFSKVD